MLHVCSLQRLKGTVYETRASHVVSLLGRETHVSCPPGVSRANHLWLKMHDITTPLDGHVVPGENHVAELVDFARRWDRAAPMVIHCFAGISRSTASAFIVACALDPQRDEHDIARAIRDSSATASPNTRLVALADALLAREGRMVAAIDAIGRGVIAEEGVPFRLDL